MSERLYVVESCRNTAACGDDDARASSSFLYSFMLVCAECLLPFLSEYVGDALLTVVGYDLVRVYYLAAENFAEGGAYLRFASAGHSDKYNIL